jgi:hypothetical protein
MTTLFDFFTYTLQRTITGATDPITQFYNKFHRYPGNNKQWWAARADFDDDDKHIKAGDFLPELLDKLFSGNNHAPRGHFIVNAFYKDRAGVARTSGIPIEITNERPTSIAFYSGRVWYGCNSSVYFSQLLTDRHRAGLCYQEADPTAEDISDLIATDGGVIPIPEATKIVKLVPHGAGILVFSINGVWNVTSTNGGFTPTDFSVDKISPIGCKNPKTVVETEDSVFWWGDIGIMGMQEKVGMYGPIPGAFDRTNISENTIQTLYNDISEDAKKDAKGVFDTRNNRIVWLYRDDDVGATQYNRAILFDLSLSAFYPWKFSSDSGSPVCKGLFLSERINLIDTVEDIVAGGILVTAGGVQVESTNTVASKYPSDVEFTSMINATAHFAQIRNVNFVDWEANDDVGLTYDSYIETGYELFNDAMRKKNITYILTYLKQTESSWVDGVGGPELDDPSSCFLTVKWDWANTTTSNKWTTPVQVYRPGRFFPMSGSDYDTGFPIVISKNKVRGNGKAIQFRFGTNERERNFDIHGWSIAVTGNTVP